MLSTAVIGVMFGFLGSIPVAGPIAILVVARGLEQQRRSALMIATGAAIAESVYAYLAYWGFGELLDGHPWITTASHGAAAVILLGLSWLFLRKSEPKAVNGRHQETKRGALKNLLLGFTITGLNPTLIATWTAAITALFGSGVVEFSPGRASIFALGSMIGIVSWFALLLLFIHHIRARIDDSMLSKLRTAMAIVLFGIGLWFLGLFVTGLF